MLKYKFLHINLPEGLERTYEYLVGAPFVTDGQSGFDAVSFARDHFEAKFTEQVITNEKIADPFGNVQEVVTTRYVTNEFLVFDFNGNFVLALRNPSRSVNVLIKRLSGLIGTGFFAASIVTEIERFGSFVREKHGDLGLVATKVLASNLALDSHSTASIELFSGLDALQDLRRHFPSQELLIERARFSLVDHGKRSQLEIKSSGVIGIIGSKSKVLEDLTVSFIKWLYG